MKPPLLTALTGLTAATVCAQLPQADILSGETYLPFDSKTLASRSDYTVNPANLELSKYGGWLNGPRQTATGFFRVEKINGRWWAIDPEGYLYIHKALNSVNPGFKTADEIYVMMRQHGFSGFGNWTWNGPTGGGPAGRSVIGESTVKDTIPMAYTPRITFIGNYRNARLPAGTPRIELPVFDPGFETKAIDYAQGFLPFLNDPHLFGYFSDNELPFRYVLRDHLAITNANDPNYQTALSFLAGRGKDPSTWDQADADAYTALAGERYYSVVSQAIRSVDPNHMYLGSRQHSAEKSNQAFMENAGQYVDIMSLNHYHHWGDRRIDTSWMTQWLGRPLMFTEFYVKSLEDGTTAGAGFNGRNQTARALFYQNFVSTLAESGNLVGFHWFKYGNGENNTGVISTAGEPYTELLDSMKQMNTRLYDFIDFVDSRRPAPDAVLTPEADAYFEGGANRGKETDFEFKAKYASSPGISTFRQTYMRFEVSALEDEIASARIVLRTVQPGGTGVFQVELVEDDSWEETTIRNSNAPAGSTVIRSFSDGRSDLEIDVTSVLREEIAGDGKLSIRIIGTGDYNTVPVYGSSRHPDPLARPALIVDYPKPVYWTGTNGAWGDAANWSTDSAATAPNPAAAPGDFDDVRFNVTGQDTDRTVDLNNLDRVARSMIFSSSGTTFFQRDSVNAGTNHIALGAGGLTMQPGAGAVTFGNPTQKVELIAKTSLSITNDSSSLLLFNSPVSSAPSYITTTLSLDGSGPGGVDFDAPINDGTSINARTALDINTTGGFTILRNGSSDFSGGLTLNQGVLAVRGSNTLGTGPLTINGGTLEALVSPRSISNDLIVYSDFRLGGVFLPNPDKPDATLAPSTLTINGDVNLGGSTRVLDLDNSTIINGIVSDGGLTIDGSAANRVLTLGGESTYTGPTTVNSGGLVINGDNSAATGQINVAAGASIGGNGTSGGVVALAAAATLNARITDWTGEAGTGYDELAVASLDAGGGALNLVVTATGLINFTETNQSFTILNASGGITGFVKAQVTITATNFSGTGTWALDQVGTSLVLEYTVDPYLAWIDHFDVSDESEGGDPDRDDSINLMEFVLNGNPGISDTSILPDMDLSTTNFTFSYARRVDSSVVRQVVQYGSDLSGWTDVVIPNIAGTTTVGAATVIVGEPASGTQTVTVRIPPSSPEVGKLFGRLKVGS